MDVKKRAHFAERLRKERERVSDVLERIAANAGGGRDEGGGPSPGEEGEAGAVGSAPDDDTAVAVREVAALTEIDRALRLLTEEPDRYGVCTVCGRPIAAGRLELVPAARTCQRHAAAG